MLSSSASLSFTRTIPKPSESDVEKQRRHQTTVQQQVEISRAKEELKREWQEQQRNYLAAQALRPALYPSAYNITSSTTAQQELKGKMQQFHQRHMDRTERQESRESSQQFAEVNRLGIPAYNEHISSYAGYRPLIPPTLPLYVPFSSEFESTRPME